MVRLPSSNMSIHNCEDFEHLPFHTILESLWNTIAYNHDPRNEEQMGSVDLTPLASIIVKILHRDIYRRYGTPTWPHFQVLIATYRIIKGMHVNWSGLVFKSMERCVKEGSDDIFFPRLLSRLFSRVDMAIPLKPYSKCKLMRFQASSFNCRYVNQFVKTDDNSEDFQNGVLENQRRINDLQEQFKRMLENNIRSLDEQIAQTQRLMDLQEIVKKLQQLPTTRCYVCSCKTGFWNRDDIVLHHPTSLWPLVDDCWSITPLSEQGEIIRHNSFSFF